jgi:beta-lactamase class A
MKRKIIVLMVLLAASLFGAFFLYNAYIGYQRFKNQHNALEYKKELWQGLKKGLEREIRNFKGDVSIVIKDFNTDWEIDFNKQELVPSASLIKIPIMLSCFYAESEGRVCLTDKATLRRCDKVAGSKVLGTKPAGSVFTIEELLNPMITLSDNASANVLIDFLGFDTLNAYFRKMGLRNTNLARKMMDFKERSEGEENYTTAEDMAYLLEKLYRGDFLNKDVSHRCLTLLGQQKINDRIPRKLPKNETFIAHKTGLERHVCHDVGIVFTQKGDFMICVLVKHDERLAKNAKRLIANVALATYRYYQSL